MRLPCRVVWWWGCGRGRELRDSGCPRSAYSEEEFGLTIIEGHDGMHCIYQLLFSQVSKKSQETR